MILRWILVDIIQSRTPWVFGVIIARLVVALIATIMDVIVSTWLPAALCQ